MVRTTPSRNGRLLKYRRRKGIGPAVVQIKADRIYLGKYGS